MKGLSKRALLRALFVPALLAVVLAGFCARAFALTTETVYLYVGGNPVLETSDSYDGGGVFDGGGHQIGTVPAPVTDGHIFDSNNNKIGFISPSPAASSELP